MFFYLIEEAYLIRFVTYASRKSSFLSITGKFLLVVRKESESPCETSQKGHCQLVMVGLQSCTHLCGSKPYWTSCLLMSRDACSGAASVTSGNWNKYHSLIHYSAIENKWTLKVRQTCFFTPCLFITTAKAPYMFIFCLCRSLHSF